MSCKRYRTRLLHFAAKQSATIVAILVLLGLGAAGLAAEEGVSLHPPDQSFLENNCFYCHQGEEAEAGLDLSRLGHNLSDRTTEQRWVRILAGGGFRHGQHLAFDRNNNYPLPNLYVPLLQQTGLEQDRFATSTGTMTGL